ncbi:MAG: signal peptidase II [Ilumatobacter sp.]
MSSLHNAVTSTLKGPTLRWIAVCVVLDLSTKYLAVQVGSGLPFVTVSERADLQVGNLFVDPTDVRSLFLIIVGVAVCRHALALTQDHQHRPLVLAPIIGGALANTLDRLATGVVHDWLDVGVFTTNLAEVMMFAGLVVYVWLAWRVAPSPDDRRTLTTPVDEQNPQLTERA